MREERKQFKLPAAWIIEQCGFKGQREGLLGMHDKQALVLTHLPTKTERSSISQLMSLAQRIQQKVADRFSVNLELEPVVYS